MAQTISLDNIISALFWALPEWTPGLRRNASRDLLRHLVCKLYGASNGNLFGARVQTSGRGFTRVLTKGGHIRDFVPLQAQAREVLEEWFTERGDSPGPLLTTRSGKRPNRRQILLILTRVAAQASAHLPAGEQIYASPHILRHTFLRKLAEEKGVQYAKEASGHKSDRYIGRYVKPDQQSLAEAIDTLDG